ncbi:MAG: ROK family protein [Deltaproteobacteria bacterium]|nr:MAG: ROK family protein [Deltaproteobacteria bacterium]
MIVGVDIGGSGVRAARVEQGRIVDEIRRVGLDDREPNHVVQIVASLARELGATALGVGVPGFVHRGVVLGSPNFPSFDRLPLQDLLQEATRLPVIVGNDANVAALGVWAERGGREDLILLTLGTGVGGGVVLGGRLLEGAGGTGAELGHLHVGGERRCGCGGLGCLETWCGTVGLLAIAAERGQKLSDGAAIVKAAEQGQEWAVEVLGQASLHLGKGLISLVNLFNPEVIVLAGGLAEAGHWFQPAERYMRRYAILPSAELVQVVWGGRADRWAILGAGALARSIR